MIFRDEKERPKRTGYCSGSALCLDLKTVPVTKQISAKADLHQPSAEVTLPGLLRASSSPLVPLLNLLLEKLG